MSTKSTKKASGNGNGVKHGGTPPKGSGSKAAVLTERAWKKTYENRGKSKPSA
jgi:hypothetical protein